MPTPNMSLPSKLKSREERDKLNRFLFTCLHEAYCSDLVYKHSLALASKGFTVFILDKYTYMYLYFRSVLSVIYDPFAVTFAFA